MIRIGIDQGVCECILKIIRQAGVAKGRLCLTYSKCIGLCESQLCQHCTKIVCLVKSVALSAIHDASGIMPLLSVHTPAM